jgi:maltose O-acetyltransferase
MNTKVLAGSVLAFAYNGFVGRLPSRCLRSAYLKLYLARFGRGTGVQMGCRFLNGRKVFLGDRNVINFDCLLDGRRHAIRVGNDVSIGPEASILTLGHDPQSADFADKGGEVVIGDRAWICYRAIILPGVIIGEGAVVAAGAVVSRGVAPYTIVAGSPAKPVGTRTKDLRYSCKFSPWFV